MKNLKSIALSLVVLFSTATINAQAKKIDVSKSNISWVGKKVTGKHNGVVNFKDGLIILKANKVVGGKFTVDMTSLTATDLTGEYQAKLNGHLKSEDFFATDKFTTSTLVIKKIAATSKDVYAVTADLTIKGKTNPVTFDLIVKGNTASAKFNVDRTKYDIKYGSGSFFDNLGDKAISNEFELAVDLKF
ncbi:YceI family protein [Flavobacterium sp. 7A]|uniref:YceI family protein n=1 Tax=Flavobacterium sp. 7A TaxID=2940571 RepID=UPI002226F1F0|nr:YceI family protein [Flavobacterium sp. 7A]MCW2118544.1 polyisoprenoid-binding protein YceI [Flavobacterium sp. 7A]